MLFYISAMVWVLAEVELWSTVQLKLTIIWVVSVAAVMLFRVNSISEDEHFFKKAIQDNIKIIIVLEFVINVYSLSLWIELILVPLLAILAGILVIAESDKKYAQVEKAINWFLETTGLGLLAYAIYRIAVDFGSFANIENLQDFTLPPIMSIAYLPFVYFIALFMTYEVLFVRLGFFIKESHLLRYTKLRTLINMNVNLSRLKKWSKHITSYDFSSEDSIDQSVINFNAKDKEQV